LTDLRLIRGVRRVKLGTGSQSRNDSRNEMMISPPTHKTAQNRGLKPLKMEEEIWLR
jgi:hypothetical protein